MWLQKSLQSRLRSSTSEKSERLKIARDLHDTLAQEIVAIGYACDEAIALSPMGSARQSLLDIRERLTLLSTTLRDEIAILRDDHPNLGLLLNRYLIELASQGHLTIHNYIPSDLTFNEEQTLELFRAIRELITNTVKHGDAHTITVKCESQEGNIYLTILDDGKPFSGATQRNFMINGSSSLHHFGLDGVYERLHAIGGSLEFSRVNNENHCRITVAP